MKQLSDIKDMVKDQKKVRFSYYKEGEFWYSTEDGFSFPVPIDELGTACLMAEDKAILFMRYIRKHITMLNTLRENSGVPPNINIVGISPTVLKFIESDNGSQN